MIDRTALREALAQAESMKEDYLSLSSMVDQEFSVGLAEHDATSKEEMKWEGLFDAILVAAHFAEKLLPDKCETCDGLGVLCRYDPPHDDGCRCPACDGTGKVWDEELVAHLAQVYAEAEGFISPLDGAHDAIRAVLAALVKDRS